MPVRWTPERVARARDVMAATPRGRYSDALARLGCTDDEVRGAFRRAGLQSPRSYCVDTIVGTPPAFAGAPVAALDYDDDEDTRPARDTEPAPPCRAHVDVEPEPDEWGTIRPAHVVGPMHADRLTRWLIIPDVHAPFHSRGAWRLAMNIGRWLQPDGVVILGDLADCYAVSAHSRDPSRVNRFAEEIATANALLDEVDALGARQVVFCLGNHEDRTRRYVFTRAPELAAMGGIEEWLRLRERGYLVTPYRHFARIGSLHVTHEHGFAGKFAAFRARESFEGAIAIGHTHRLATMHSGSVTGGLHPGATLGWLGDATTLAVDYTHRIEALRSWTHAVGVAWVHPDGGTHLEAVPFVNRRAVVAGTLVAA